MRSAIDVELDSLAAELMQAYESAQTQSRAEFDIALASRIAAARTEVEAAAASRMTALRSEMETAAAGREAAARATADREFAARSEAVRAAALAEARSGFESERTETVSVQVSEREGRLESVERLLASVRRLDAASSLRETLEVLVQSASLETPRVAVLVIEGPTVRAFAQRGFNAMPDEGPLAAGGVVEASVQHGQPAFTSDAAGLKAPGFAALPADRAGFAAPLRVGNRTVAVLYADDAGEGQPAAPAAWPEALELLSRHASMHLENLTALRAFASSSASSSSQFLPDEPVGDVVEQTSEAATELRTGTGTGSDQDDDAARRYAKLLVSEIKLYNEATVRAGRERRALRSMLSDEIEHAEQTYLARIPETVAGRRAYFETELVQTLGGGDAGTLGDKGRA
ncbi:MAG: hypothetical protein M3Q55_17320 [Acidobacteriota bacterium]|nr:hypothetical protein [Acidobacteriota bacterium]